MSGLVERRPADGRATRWAPCTTITIHEEYAMADITLPLIPLDFLGYADSSAPLSVDIAPAALHVQAADEDEDELDEDDDLEDDEDDEDDDEDELDEDDLEILDEDDEDDEDDEEEEEEEELEA
jgi:hypothetical protein